MLENKLPVKSDCQLLSQKKSTDTGWWPFRDLNAPQLSRHRASVPQLRPPQACCSSQGPGRRAAEGLQGQGLLQATVANVPQRSLESWSHSLARPCPGSTYHPVILLVLQAKSLASCMAAGQNWAELGRTGKGWRGVPPSAPPTSQLVAAVCLPQTPPTVQNTQ